MGIEQNFNKNLKKSVKDQMPSLPTNSKFIFQQLLKNSHHIEENLKDETMLEINVGDLKHVMKNMKEKRTLNEAAKCQFSFECGAGKYCRKKNPDDFYGRCKKDNGSEMFGGTEKGLPIDKEETDLKDLIKRTVKENKVKKGDCGCEGYVNQPGVGKIKSKVCCKNKSLACKKDNDCWKGGKIKKYDNVVDDLEREKEMEEVTSTASSGAYVTPRFWAKKKRKKKKKVKSRRKSKSDGKRLMPGAKYVKVKDKCKKFPYCNQGDIGALEIWEKEIMRESAKNVAKKTGKPESEVREMIEKELAEIIRRGFYKSPVTDLVGGGKMKTPIGKIFNMNSPNVGPKYES